ncbi:hypothetical protein HYDPIDRAFT_42334 [Hydnomerulius pinastri MD-312]|uniref:Thiaminase-2/PQQC domain-containing protein n=1 Tax=Hydnomerulius pinastri MD-312 TaxID=994086 RepID=A0A0C9V834_9AGAM|nr:hypothetical protein HYDPIDRAFT_42334 [Hydnomerulius pinastri MD-312]
MATPTLTSHLTSLSTPRPYSSAISHPFLTSAASLTLPTDALAFWLSQDRIYAAQAYPRFVAQLITKIPLDAPPSPSHADLSHQTLQVLVGCLTNIVREVNFFDETARNYDLPIGSVGGGEVWVERKATRDYTAEMARVAALGTLQDGLVFLWAMEKVYLDAWTTVHNTLTTSNEPIQDTNLTARAIKDLSHNWSSANPGFDKFVKEIGDLVDAYFAPVMSGGGSNGAGIGGRTADDALARAEAIWARVIELEEQFWPVKNEELGMRVAGASGL